MKIYIYHSLFLHSDHFGVYYYQLIRNKMASGRGLAGNVTALPACYVHLEPLNIAQVQVSSSPSRNFAKVKKNQVKRSRRSRPSGNFLNLCCQIELVKFWILEKMVS